MFNLPDEDDDESLLALLVVVFLVVGAAAAATWAATCAAVGAVAATVAEGVAGCWDSFTPKVATGVATAGAPLGEDDEDAAVTVADDLKRLKMPTVVCVGFNARGSIRNFVQ